ncbi:protein LURP-one-related 8-like [Panicum virgatum]|uniref:protein LURP-one-related 8-like n=1 Tax=Panicum virgatum TaxID=38727 RepID=UPI0019D5837E|nr:protein LURP-one-related 8-like [Panicum virgatum]
MTTTRIHPSPETTRPLIRHRSGGDSSAAAAALRYTVWKRSSMGFQGTDGFSVYDAGGALAFRVDNYSRRRKIFVGELLLMDGQGSPLLALRPQALSMAGHGPSFWVEGCFRRRSCKIRNSDGKEVARITRKKAEAAASSLMLGDDVFRLMIQPNVDCTMIMAFIVVLDRICSKPFTPMMCSS